jgi:glycerophosphoryl diester phosphodiesterase
LLVFYAALLGFSGRLIAQNTSDFVPGLRTPRNGGVYVIAHRGVHNSIPENTLAAYQAAIELGCDFVEIDVRTTKDKHLVSIHDSTVDRYTIDGTKGAVDKFTLAELKSMDIGSRIDRKWGDERVPTVEEILTLCQGRIGIYLDVKAANLEALVELVRRYKMEKDVLWYIPADKVEPLRELCPDTWPMPDPGPEKNLQQLLQRCKPQVVASVWKYFSPTFVSCCHEHKAIVIVDDEGPETWKAMLEAGVDGIQTDQPAELIRYLSK